MPKPPMSPARLVRQPGHLSATQRAPNAGSTQSSPLSSLTLKPGALRRFRSRSMRSEEHTSELQSLMRISYAVFCLKKKTKKKNSKITNNTNQIRKDHPHNNTNTKNKT